MKNIPTQSVIDKYGIESYSLNVLENLNTPFLRALYRCHRYHGKGEADEKEKGTKKFAEEMTEKVVKGFGGKSVKNISGYLPQKATHISKFLHSLSSGSNILQQSLLPLSGYVDGGELSVLEKEWFDVTNPATFVGVAVFLSMKFHHFVLKEEKCGEEIEEDILVCRTHDEPKENLLETETKSLTLLEMCEHFSEEKRKAIFGERISEAIFDFYTKAKTCAISEVAFDFHAQTKDCTSTQKEKKFASDAINAQVFFPLNETMEMYHLILPMRSSQMILAVNGIEKVLREEAFDCGYKSFFSHLSYSFGGTKPQNVSDNARNSDKVCIQLLPKNKRKSGIFPSGNLFYFFLPSSRPFVQKIADSFSTKNNQQTRETKLLAFSSLVRLFLSAVRPLQIRTDTWSEKYCPQLTMAQKRFLNPARFKDIPTDDFFGVSVDNQVLSQIGRDFVLWLENQLERYREEALGNFSEKERQGWIKDFVTIAEEYYV